MSGAKVATTALQSMTGYAQREAEVRGQKFRLHIKSVNHRYFDWKWRAPRGWTAVEPEARAFMQERLQRGAVECVVEEATGGGSGANEGAKELFARLNAAIEQSREASGLRLPNFVRAMVLARFPDAWAGQDSVRTPVAFADLKVDFEKLARELLDARLMEGHKTSVVLITSTDRLEKLLEQVEGSLPEMRARLKEAFEQRLATIAAELRVPEIQETRLLQEYAMILERKDVSEETSRIRMHLESMRKLLATPGPQAGKRIEFLLQEFHREWTTLGNKIQDPRFTEPVLEAKLELDRIKEQAANIA